MTTVRDAIREKFAATGSPTRRPDFKGARRRINLRVGSDLAAQLQIIRLATGEATNGFCERVLGAAIRATLTTLETQHDPQTWQTLLTLAKRSGAGPVGD